MAEVSAGQSRVGAKVHQAPTVTVARAAFPLQVTAVTCTTPAPVASALQSAGAVIGYGYCACVIAVGTRAVALVGSESVNVNVVSAFTKLPFTTAAPSLAAVAIAGAWWSEITVNAVTAAFVGCQILELAGGKRDADRAVGHCCCCYPPFRDGVASKVVHGPLRHTRSKQP